MYSGCQSKFEQMAKEVGARSSKII
nr:hypothetical protein [Anaerobium acetethylicum]